MPGTADDEEAHAANYVAPAVPGCEISAKASAPDEEELTGRRREAGAQLSRWYRWSSCARCLLRWRETPARIVLAGESSAIRTRSRTGRRDSTPYAADGRQARTARGSR